MGKGKRKRFAGTVYERSLRAEGFRLPAGVDEAGRGSLAGPVVAAAVIFAPGRPPVRVADSKLLRPEERERLAERILERAVAVGVAVVPSREVDALNVHRAALRAMRDAVSRLRPSPDAVLVDGWPIPGLSLPQRALARGDRLCASIAAASIVAKVARDRIMDAYDAIYPGFRFRVHKGYGTPDHLEALERLGPTPLHRRTFRPVRAALLPFGPV